MNDFNIYNDNSLLQYMHRNTVYNNIVHNNNINKLLICDKDPYVFLSCLLP